MTDSLTLLDYLDLTRDDLETNWKERLKLFLSFDNLINTLDGSGYIGEHQPRFTQCVRETLKREEWKYEELSTLCEKDNQRKMLEKLLKLLYLNEDTSSLLRAFLTTSLRDDRYHKLVEPLTKVVVAFHEHFAPKNRPKPETPSN